MLLKLDFKILRAEKPHFWINSDALAKSFLFRLLKGSILWKRLNDFTNTL